ncbi:hypothetical protein HJC23_009104 [Cyclotella cryptica]|uniref:Capsule synthesis protein CapA domain-containing protein n=1 Tax=Cyclotella cryptica TaxID=29204 RepID=A0ABD3QYP6_9STRA|eukprot:CCRYP_000739-RA/>CCRYP_000739-RA protein AED:0.00 eAED:-0.00 QI:0/-1/0/1/-1/1/1/0/496
MHIPAIKTTSAPTLLRILFNGGDNMLGRAVQLSFPVQSPHEELLRDSCTAEHYLNLCLHPTATNDHEAVMSLEEIRRANMHGTYLWGDYLKLTLNQPPDLRLMNLETALTRSIDNDDIPWEKGINYHFHLDNFKGVMEGYQAVPHARQEEHGDDDIKGQKAKEDAAEKLRKTSNSSPLCITLANNHIIDFGRQAFVEETLPFLNSYTKQCQGFAQFAGAGSNIHEASRPAHWTLNLPSTNDEVKQVEVYVMAAGSMDSGVPRQWGAATDSAGVFQLPRLDSMHAVNDAVDLLKYWMGIHGIAPTKLPSSKSLVILSVHWGPNWAYRYSGDNQKFRREFAHACIDQCGVDIIYGHSSHHIRGIEGYNGKLIIYGAGDLINDYEGFANAGDEKYCKFGALFLADFCIETKDLYRLTLVPTFMNRLQLKLLCPSDSSVRDIWNPRNRTNDRGSNIEHASCLCTAINDLTKLDAGSKQGLKLRLSKDPVCNESEYVLVYP